MWKKLGRKSLYREWFLPAPLSLYLCDERGAWTGEHSLAKKSRSHKSSNISPASTHNTNKSHLATCRSVKWCHDMGETVPRPIPALFYFSLFQYWRVKFFHHTCSWEMYSITLWKHMLGVSTWCNKHLRAINCHFVLPNTIEISHFLPVLVMVSI